MNFTQTSDRGYTYKPNDPRDIEFKMLLSIQGGGDFGFSISGPTGRHSGSGCCSGFDYMINVAYNENPAVWRFRKEMWHVSYHTEPTLGEWTHPDCNFKLSDHGFVGIGYVKYNKKDGISVGKDSVVLEVWFNPDPEADLKHWIMLNRVEDKGGWGNDGDECNGDPDHVGNWGGPKYRIKSNDDDCDITFKHMSLREIDPTKSFDDDPDVPPPGGEPPVTTKVQGNFKFQQDINTLRSSPCAGAGAGGGAGSGNAIFWTTSADNDTPISNSTTFENRTRVVEVVKTSTSSWNGKKVLQLDVPLKKVGTPTTPNIQAKIWNSSGTVLYTSPTNLDPATLTTSFVKKTFDFSTNTVTMVPGLRIGVEWTGTSSSSYPVAGYQSGSVSSASVYADYEDGSWIETNTRDWAVDAWQ